MVSDARIELQRALMRRGPTPCQTSAIPDAWDADPASVASMALADDAKGLCASCPCRAQCLAAALEGDERYGIWGGRTPAERRELRRA